MKYRSVAFALVLLGTVLVSGTAQAASSTASLAVSVTVVSSCQASSLLAAAQGTQSASRSSAGSAVAVACSLPTAYNVVYGEAGASDAGAATQKTAGIGPGSSQPRTVHSQAADEQYVPPDTHPGAALVTIYY